MWPIFHISTNGWHLQGSSYGSFYMIRSLANQVAGGCIHLRVLNMVEYALHIVSVTSKYVWKLFPHRANLPGREINLGSVISFNQRISLFIRPGNELQMTPLHCSFHLYHSLMVLLMTMTVI